MPQVIRLGRPMSGQDTVHVLHLNQYKAGESYAYSMTFLGFIEIIVIMIYVIFFSHFYIYSLIFIIINYASSQLVSSNRK